MTREIVLIKLGGSIITNKDIPMSVRQDVLSRLVKEIARAKKEHPELLFVVGHGQGSFAHMPATKYKTIDGFVNKESILGMAIVMDSAAQLNRIVVHEFLKEEVPAVSLLPGNSLITHKRKPETVFTKVFEEYIDKGLFPVTGGDVLVDTDQGCTIWSTEEVLAFFAEKFMKENYKVRGIVHVAEVEGVYDSSGKVVSHINKGNWSEVKKAINGTKGFDVTGGMGLKVEESLKLADLGVSSKIVSGMKANNLYNALVGKPFSGTVIA
jgi:isopentenyl phosphate kinase